MAEFMDKVDRYLNKCYDNMLGMSKFISPRLFYDVLKRFKKNQKFFKASGNDKKVQTHIITIFRDSLNENKIKSHSVIWEKITFIFKTLG